MESKKLCVLCGERELGKNLSLLCQECFDYCENHRDEEEDK